MKAMRKKDRIIYADEEEVEEMLNTWDVVYCKICGKKTSMLNAKMSKEGDYFICKGHK